MLKRNDARVIQCPLLMRLPVDIAPSNGCLQTGSVEHCRSVSTPSPEQDIADMHCAIDRHGLDMVIDTIGD